MSAKPPAPPLPAERPQSRAERAALAEAIAAMTPPRPEPLP